VEIAFEAVADRFVQKDARPTRPEHDRHLPGRGGYRFEIDQCLPERLVDCIFPVARIEIGCVTRAAAAAVASGFLPPVLFDDNRNAKAHERADVTPGLAAGAND